jgi:WD40 repeat protein
MRSRKLRLVRHSKARRGTPRSFSFDPTGEFLAVAWTESTEVTIWQIATKTFTRRLPGHRGPVRSVAWSPDGLHIATASRDGAVLVWDASSDRKLRSLPDVGTIPDQVVWAPDSRRLAVLYFGTAPGRLRQGLVVIWDALHSIVELTTQADHMLRNMAWAPDGRSLVLGRFASKTPVLIVDAATGSRREVPVSQRSGCTYGAAWSPDGRYLAVSFHFTVEIWDSAGEHLLYTFDRGGYPDGSRGRARSPAWSPDSTRIAVASDHKEVEIWDLRYGKVRGRTGTSDYLNTSAVWSPDRRYLAVGDYGANRVQVWDGSTLKLTAFPALGVDRRPWLDNTPDATPSV